MTQLLHQLPALEPFQSGSRCRQVIHPSSLIPYQLINPGIEVQDLRKFPVEPPCVGANGRSPLLSVVSMRKS